jgi:hypothetical protein
LTNFEELVVPMPALLWVIKYTDGKMTGANLFAAPHKILSLREGTNVATFPWGNANVGSGVVCWGDVSIETLRPEDPWLVDELFFKSKLNDHLWHAQMAWEPNNAHWKRWLKDHPGEPGQVDYTQGRAAWPAIQGALAREW